MVQAILSAPATSRLLRFDRRWRDLPEELRAAILELIAEPYLRLGYPTEAAFASAFDVAIDSPEYRAAWAAALAQRKRSHRAAYGDDDWICGLCARGRDGTLVALATFLTVYGTRDVPLGRAIGDPQSSLSTLRMLRFTCDGGPGSLDPQIPERRLAEIARLTVLQRPELRALVEAGTLTPEDADYVERHGFNEMLATPYRRDQGRPDAPLAYLGNTRQGILKALIRRELDVRELYLAAGAEPTARVLGSGESTSVYFNWLPRLQLVVPEAILARGVAAAVHYLARQDGVDWDTLAVSLPFCIMRSAQSDAAAARLLQSCGRLPDRT